MDQIAPADDLSSFLEILPPNIRETLGSDTVGLYEVVLDLGRLPEARYLDRGATYLSDEQISQDDLDAAISLIGEFSGDNRAGIERTLHASQHCATAQAKSLVSPAVSVVQFLAPLTLFGTW